MTIVTQNQNTTADREAVTAGIAKYIETLQAAKNEEYARWYTNLTVPTVEVSTGKRYAKVFTKDSGAIAFIDLADGNVYKAATWNAPAKHARGNVLSEKSGFEYSNAQGPFYLR